MAADEPSKVSSDQPNQGPVIVPMFTIDAVVGPPSLTSAPGFRREYTVREGVANDVADRRIDRHGAAERLKLVADVDAVGAGEQEVPLHLDERAQRPPVHHLRIVAG